MTHYATQASLAGAVIMLNAFTQLAEAATTARDAAAGRMRRDAPLVSAVVDAAVADRAADLREAAAAAAALVARERCVRAGSARCGSGARGGLGWGVALLAFLPAWSALSFGEGVGGSRSQPSG